MGMYTELILGASLKGDTPSQVIETLRQMVNGGKLTNKPDHPFFQERRAFILLTCSCCYFGVSSSIGRFWNSYGNYKITTRSAIKNYNGEIEKFLDWIKPYIKSGSGDKDMYAITTFEDGEPHLYFLQ